jgi:hypothetical protein
MSSSGIIAPPSGIGATASQNVQSSVLPVPQNCTASGFKVVQFGAANSSTAQVFLVAGSNSLIATSFINPTAISCTLTAASGGFTTCTSTSSASLSAGTLIGIVVFNFSNLPDFQNARIMTSFVCQ